MGKKYQGVETPSQARYLKYYEEYLAREQVMPDQRFVKINEFKIRNLLKIKPEAVREMKFRVFQGRREIRYGDLFFKIGCQTNINEEDDLITITLTDPPTVGEDVKIVFYCKLLPTHYWKSAFYFLFNTRFLPASDNNGNLSLLLPRAELDNPHKLAKFYGDDFSVEVIMCDTSAP